MAGPVTAESVWRWWLALEPLGDDVVWALTRVHRDRPPTGPVGAGLFTGLGEVRALTESAQPTAADPWSGPLTDPRLERALAVTLGRALLPGLLRDALRGADPDHPDTLAVAVRGWLARVPWDSLSLDARGDVRLLETARVLGGLAATLDAGRARIPDPEAAGPALRVIDPGPSRWANGRSGAKLYPTGTPGEWFEQCTDTETIEPLGGSFSRDDLSDRLRTDPPSRLLYLGHATPGTVQAPARAALLLSDAGGGDELTAFQWLREPDRYPAPPRVALIACGSDDTAEAEQSGLPIAAINAGAGLVTATRWILPTDPAPGGADGSGRPTTALALAVDAAHTTASPIDELRTWQRHRLDAWRDGGRHRDAPLLWSSLVTYLAPGQPRVSR